MTVVGMVGYIQTPRGLRTLSTVWAKTLSASFKRHFYKNWYKSKGKAFKKYENRWIVDNKDKTSVHRDIERIRKFCSVVRVILHSSVE